MRRDAGQIRDRQSCQPCAPDGERSNVADLVDHDERLRSNLREQRIEFLLGIADGFVQGDFAEPCGATGPMREQMCIRDRG